MFVPTDKSRNVYLLSKDEYQKLLTENITKAYKMTNRRKVYNINNETKSIGKPLSIDDHIERMYENESHINIKDHKEHFPSKISCTLINPSKSDIGKIRKTILDKIITKIVSLTNVNQWKNISYRMVQNIPEERPVQTFTLQFHSSFPMKL